MGKIKYAVFDLDGVLSKGEIFSKDPSGDMLQGERENLEKWRQFMKDSEVQCIAVTGRSLEITRELLSHMDCISACEHGTVIFDPKTEESYSTIDCETQFGNLIGAKNRLEEFIEKSEEFDELLLKKFPGESIKRMRENLHILTYEFEREKGLEFAEELYSEIATFLPENILDDISQGKLVLKKCGMAIDIMPAVTKSEGLSHILSKLEISPDEVLIAGDSFHSDGPMMRVVEEGFWICPANSDRRLKEEILARGSQGYVSEKPFFEGSMEGLRYFLE